MSLGISKLTRQLCRSNVAIVQQKIDLLHVMKELYRTDDTNTPQSLYQCVCPIVQASIGQHVRHSLDHIEKAVDAALFLSNDASTRRVSIPYDVRTRGGTDEQDMQAAEDRMESIQSQFHILMERLHDDEDKDGTAVTAIPEMMLVDASFCLSSDDGHHSSLPSTIPRELGFAAHHAIHHMAMIRIITQQTLAMPVDKLPPDFGKAPSTIVFETKTSATTKEDR